MYACWLLLGSLFRRSGRGTSRLRSMYACWLLLGSLFRRSSRGTNETDYQTKSIQNLFLHRQ